jgi:glycosyltransferase involved in cell wall biosynthesis
MKVALYPSDTGGCGTYRIINPAQALLKLGYDIELVLPEAPAEYQIRAQWFLADEPGSEPEIVDVEVPEADVVVLQRPMRANIVRCIEILQAKGVRVVVELDDDLANIGTRHGYRSIDPRLSAERNWEHLLHACAIADLVTVSTPKLAEVYAPHGRFVVLRNFVPAAYLAIEGDPHDGTYVGWSGSIDTHPYDLQTTGRGVASALAKTGAQMAIVGNAVGVPKALQCGRVVACGYMPLDQYPVALAQFDVGIVPLEAGRFNECKSWLKGLEMASVGVPFVATPTGEYTRLAHLGAGLLAERPNQWEGCVKKLVRDPAFRAEMGRRARETASRLTIEGNCEQWWDAWESVVNTACAR